MIGKVDVRIYLEKQENIKTILKHSGESNELRGNRKGTTKRKIKETKERRAA